MMTLPDGTAAVLHRLVGAACTGTANPTTPITIAAVPKNAEALRATHDEDFFKMYSLNMMIEVLATVLWHLIERHSPGFSLTQYWR